MHETEQPLIFLSGTNYLRLIDQLADYLGEREDVATKLSIFANPISGTIGQEEVAFWLGAERNIWHEDHAPTILMGLLAEGN
jgi:hypothetical protein